MGDPNKSRVSGRREERLQERVARVVESSTSLIAVSPEGAIPEHKRVVAAIPVWLGQPRGVSVAVPFPLFVAFVALLFEQKTNNKSFIISVVDHRVYLLDSRYGRPTKILRVFESCDSIGLINDTVGDNFFTLAGVRYWVGGFWSAQLYIIRRWKSQQSVPEDR